VDSKIISETTLISDLKQSQWVIAVTGEEKIAEAASCDDYVPKPHRPRLTLSFLPLGLHSINSGGYPGADAVRMISPQSFEVTVAQENADAIKPVGDIVFFEMVLHDRLLRILGAYTWLISGTYHLFAIAWPLSSDEDCCRMHGRSTPRPHRF
jgi:hypothetical protein